MNIVLCILLAICLYPHFKMGLFEFLADVGLITIENNEVDGDEDEQ